MLSGEPELLVGLRATEGPECPAPLSFLAFSNYRQGVSLCARGVCLHGRGPLVLWVSEINGEQVENIRGEILAFGLPGMPEKMGAFCFCHCWKFEESLTKS